MKRVRLDVVLMKQRRVSSAREAFAIVMGGRVFVNGQKAVSPSQPVGSSDRIEVQSGPVRVGRGGVKLDAALDRFNVTVAGTVCADIGAATGGFTEALLKRGAAKVYAIDAGRGKLAEKLRSDSRVIVMERTNVLTIEKLPDPVDLAVIDVSFTSLRLVLPKIRSWLTVNGSIIALFKPQYELKDESKLRHGVVRDEALRQSLIHDFREWLIANGWRESGFMESPVRGGAGNVEYLFHVVPKEKLTLR